MFQKKRMKYNTTFLLIVFSFSLLLIWDKWATYSTVDTQSGSSEPLRANDIKSGLEKDGNIVNLDSDLPQLKELSVIKPTPIDNSVDKTKKTTLIKIKNNKLMLLINPRGGIIEYSELLDQKSDKSESGNVLLLNNSEMSTYLAQTGLISVGRTNLKLPDHLSTFSVVEKTPNQVVLITKTENVQLKKIIQLKDNSNAINVRHEIKNLSNKAVNTGLYFQLYRDSTPPEGESSFYNTYTGPVIYTKEGKFQKTSFSDIEKSKQDHIKVANDGWFGIIQHYYVVAWLFGNEIKREFYTRKLKNDKFSVGAIQLLENIEINEERSISNILYVGPQYQEELKKLEDGLELVVDYGILTVIAKPIFWLLDKLHNIVGNWGWAIVCLTITIKLFFFPLTAASYKSMAKMKAVSPKIMKIREQHKDNKMQLNNAMMELYKKEKINPLGGCLPILIQIPVFIALYWVLLASAEIRDAPWIFWIKDLSEPDPFFILPVIMAATMFIQMKLNPAPPDPLQAKIMMAMPIIFSIFFFFFPSGLVLYWLVNNIVSIAQQWSIMRKLDVKA